MPFFLMWNSYFPFDNIKWRIYDVKKAKGSGAKSVSTGTLWQKRGRSWEEI